MNSDPHKYFQLLIDQIADTVAKRLETSPAKESDTLSAKTLAKLLDCSESEIRQNIQLRRIPVVPFGSRGYRIKKKLLQIPNPMNAVDEPEQNINTIDYVPTPEDYERIITTGLIEGVRGDLLRLIGAVRYLGLRIEEVLKIKIEDCILDPDDGGLPYVWVEILKQKRKTRVPRPIRRELRDILREQIAYQISNNSEETRLWVWVDPLYKLFIVYELVKKIAKDGKCRLMRKEKGHLYDLAGVKIPHPFHDYRNSAKLELKRNPNLSKDMSRSYQGHQTESMDDYYTFFQREDLEAAVRDSYKDER